MSNLFVSQEVITEVNLTWILPSDGPRIPFMPRTCPYNLGGLNTHEQLLPLTSILYVTRISLTPQTYSHQRNSFLFYHLDEKVAKMSTGLFLKILFQSQFKFRTKENTWFVKFSFLACTNTFSSSCKMIIHH